MRHCMDAWRVGVSIQRENHHTNYGGVCCVARISQPGGMHGSATGSTSDGR